MASKSEILITGERIQRECDIYLGTLDDFRFNPTIAREIYKHVVIRSINHPFNNPRMVFCYGHRIAEFSTKLSYFKNPFVLVSHNSDQNIVETDEAMLILNHKLLIKWYAQNQCIIYPKLRLLPIGLANSQWPHGNLSVFNSVVVPSVKTKRIYFYFDVMTNTSVRNPCRDALSRIIWLQHVSHEENVRRLSEYAFCICPEGHGVDTHRFWECMYLRVVPIMLRTPFSMILEYNHYPVVLLDSWEDLDESTLDYSAYEFPEITMDDIRNTFRT